MKQVEFYNLNLVNARLLDILQERVNKFLSNGYFVGGDAVKDFENDWANYCGSKYAVGLGNGLDALTLSLKALDVGEGDEVIVPANTFIATWLAVSNCGAHIVPVEPDPNTYNIDPKRIIAKITPKTKVILPVHLYGAPAKMDEIIEISRLYGLHVVEDAAQAHGASTLNRRIGSHGDIIAWSFYPTKNLGALGDAGAITTNNEQLAKKIKILSNYGSSQKYKNEIVGVNSRLDAIQAMVLSLKLNYLDQWNEDRQRIASYYIEKLKNLPIKLPFPKPGIHHVYHQFVIECSYRDKLRDFLKCRGIQTMIHYPIPPFKQQAYAKLNINQNDYAISSSMANKMLSLPIGPYLNEEDTSYIVKSIEEFFNY